jgi:hypothetical protein
LLNAFPPASELRIQFTPDERYQSFLSRATDATVLGIPVEVACLTKRTSRAEGSERMPIPGGV